MTRERPHTGAWLCFLCPRELPQSNASIDAPTGEQAPIGTPRQREHRAAMAGERLAVRASVSIPHLDGEIFSPPAELAPIGVKLPPFTFLAEHSPPDPAPPPFSPHLLSP